MPLGETTAVLFRYLMSNSDTPHHTVMPVVRTYLVTLDTTVR